MKIRYIVYAVLFLGLAYLVYYRISENKKVEEGGAGAGKGPKGGAGGKGGPGITVEGIVVETTAFDNNLEVTGSIEANESVVLRSEVPGLVTGIYFKEGTNVTKGTLLVKVNDRDIQAQLREVISKQTLSQTNENRAKQLLQKGAISQEEYDTAFADLQSFKAQAALIRAQLAKTSILAPFSGKIGLREISLGEYLTPSTTIANLLSTNPVKINFSVPEKYVAQIKNGSEVTFNTDAAGKSFKGKVFAVEPGIDQQTRTLQIKALAQNAKGELIPGSFAKVKLALTTLPNAILIPTEAIIPTLKGKEVYISRDGKAKQVVVEAGTRTANRIVITEGLKVGDTVLTTGAMSLKPGSPVRVKLVKN